MKIFVWFVALLTLSPLAMAEGLHTLRPAVLYDAPSKEANPKAILTGNYPLRQISSVDGWRKVTSHNGDNGWLAEADVGAAQRAVVLETRATIFNAANESAAPVFYARRGVVLEVLGRQGQWLKILHPDGETGYVAATAVWQN